MAGLNLFEFREFTLDLSERKLSKKGDASSLAPKAFDLLAILVRHAGRLVTKRELMEQVWPEAFVEEGILTVHIAALRKALGDSGRRGTCIETVSGSGYRFIATVRPPADGISACPGTSWSLAVLPPQVRTPGDSSDQDAATALAIADALIDRLGRLDTLVVRPTQAVRSFGSPDSDARAVGRALRVDAVLESRLVRTDRAVVVSLRLVRSRDGACVWQGAFEELPANVAAIPGAVAESLAAQLELSGRGSDARPEEEDARRHNLPEQLTSFVGRGQELDQLGHLLASARLLTLTGAGGCGKTRLALQLADRHQTHFEGGVWLADLAPLADPTLLPQAIAGVLGVSEGPIRSLVDALVDHLRTRRLLLVLDNCEHLIAACAELSETLLRAAPQLRILATSREGLGIQGETVWRVPSLTLPSPGQTLTPEGLLEFEGMRLFAERAGSIAPFTLTGVNAVAVAEVCRRLDGIPLAIELAAARVSVLSVDQINVRLKDRFRLLTGGGRTAVARQRTLEATVDWSYDLLSEPERRLLGRLSVFAGGWTLEAAEEVCAGEGIERDDIVDLLSGLVDKSLVIVEEDAVGDRRYRFLETIRQYGRDRLFRSGEIGSVCARHFAFVLALARRAQPELSRSDQVRWLNRLQVEHDNIRSALEWAVGAPECTDRGLELATSVWWFWIKRGYFSEGQRRLGESLAGCTDVSPRVAKAYVGLMHFTMFQGDPGTPGAIAKSLEIARAAGDAWSEAFSLGFSAILESDAGNFERAAALAADAHRIALTTRHQEHGNQPLGLALRMMGYAALQQGDQAGAADLFEQTVTLQRHHGDKWSLGILLSDLAAVRALQGSHAAARALAHEAIDFGQQLEDRRGVAWCLQTIAMVDAAEGHAIRAARLYGAAEGLLESVGATGQVTVTRVQESYLSAAIASIGDAAFQAAATEGRAMPFAQAIQYALEGLNRPGFAGDPVV